MIDTDRLVVSGLTNSEQDWLNLLWKQLVDRRAGNLVRAQYYDGKRAASQVGTVIAPQYRRLGMVLGWAAKSVDVLSRRQNIEDFFWPDGDLDSDGYREIRDGNFLLAELKSGLVSSLIHGTSFVINTRGDVSKREPKSLVHVKDALNATGYWDNRARLLRAALSITGWDENYRQPTGFVLYLDGSTVTVDREAGKWKVDRQSHKWGVPVEPLVYRPRTGREMGTSRISKPLMSIQDRALREVARMEGHMDVYSIPQMIFLGADESMFRNTDGSQKDSWQIALGRVFGIPDDDEQEDPRLARADVKQFPASSPQPHIDFYKQLAMEFSGEASIPLTSLGVSDQSNPTSADSYLASREDLVAEAEGAVDDWKPRLNRVVARALAIQNDVPVAPAWATVEARFRNPRFISRAAAADAGAKQIGAVPWLADTEVGLELAGLSPDQVKRATAERRRAQGRTRLADLVRTGGLVGEPDGDGE